jgi:nitroreductase
MYETLLKRRSIRKYKNRSIEKEKIKKILDCVLLAPSSRNIRPCEYIIVENKDMIEKLSLCKKHGSSFLSNSPLAVVVIADKSKSDTWIEDASIASIIIQLEAENIGLKSCWIQIRNRDYNEEIKSNDYVKEILNILDNYTVESIIAIGYPDEEREPYNANEMGYDKIHYEFYKK